MTSKRVIPQRRAILDVEEIVDHSLETSPETIAVSFVDALELAYANIRQNPSIGSLRYSYELELPSLCSWMLKGYPYLTFCVERDGQVDVWRVLHGSRDMPQWIQEPPV